MAHVRKLHAWSSFLHRASTFNSRTAASLTQAGTSFLPRCGHAIVPQCSRAFRLSGFTFRHSDDFTVNTGYTQDEDDGEDDWMEEKEVEELFQELQPTTAIPGDQQQVFVLHPNVKWGSRKQHLTTAELMMAEAVALVNTLDKWTVVDRLVVSTKTPEKRKIFGKGNFQMITERIRQTAGVTAVFVNVERLSPSSERELEEAWGVKVLDRYTLVLHIFRSNAKTKEAKLQISLAEIPLLRSHLKNEFFNLDQQGGGTRYIGGSGETQLEVQQRLLRERELKIRSALEKLGRKRQMLRSRRKQKEFPIVSVLGYTNCGKTTLIKALTGDAGLHPRDQLFATLDVTVHAGALPNRLAVLYVDTVGFLSQLPHRLIDSFAATLDDIKHSDVLLHVRDVSHPENVNQKANVLNVLKNLRVPDTLLSSMIEVHNKIDLLENYDSTEPDVVAISALDGRGLDALKAEVEQRVMAATGQQALSLKVDLGTPRLSWLYREAAVRDVKVDADEGSAVVEVVIGAAAYGRYKKMFGEGQDTYD
ncbi:putative GTP-binding protein 6 [Corythoichthys intestinalis]|uniref:putative GTP-binding protein 6 n=1 Tax=Corythoichthys intestinalis TaxID=161448 RepID=UPI0025A6604B|nr:putative GTP-binding protein 6 [Corythoichthys intestinalis]XP_061790367.1 putative GTP-binding protein 6 [Nerophis lumbriciformis]